MNLKDKLQERWNNLTENESYFIYNIARLYGNRDRKYHNLTHINNCLNLMDIVKSELEDPYAVEIAIWFHDLIYYSDSTDNEMESATEATLFLERLDCEKSFIDKVYNLIMITKHTVKPKTIDEMFMADIDLASLGEDPAIFFSNQLNIYEESSLLCVDTEFDDAVFYNKNTKFLLSLLSKGYIYYTNYFNSLYEDQAQTNIRELYEYRKERGYVQ